jgi:hypothetical protein
MAEDKVGIAMTSSGQLQLNHDKRDSAGLRVALLLYRRRIGGRIEGWQPLFLPIFAEAAVKLLPEGLRELAKERVDRINNLIRPVIREAVKDVHVNTPFWIFGNGYRVFFPTRMRVEGVGWRWPAGSIRFGSRVARQRCPV